jgi:hypothetical protein
MHFHTYIPFAIPKERKDLLAAEEQNRTADAPTVRTTYSTYVLQCVIQVVIIHYSVPDLLAETLRGQPTTTQPPNQQPYDSTIPWSIADATQ